MLYHINSKTSSPCNGFCEMDDEQKFCRGCFRTMEEIISWQTFSDDEKMNIIRLVKERKERMKHN